MKHTYINTRHNPVRIYTSSGARMIGPNETFTLSEPVSSAPYWVKKVEDAAPVQETVAAPTTVTSATQETTVAKTTKARRRKTTTTIEKE